MDTLPKDKHKAKNITKLCTASTEANTKAKPCTASTEANVGAELCIKCTKPAKFLGLFLDTKRPLCKEHAWDFIKKNELLPGELWYCKPLVFPPYELGKN